MIKKSKKIIATIPESSSPKPHNVYTEDSDFNYKRQYLNYTNYPLTVIMRNNIKIPIVSKLFKPNHPIELNNHIIIRETYEFNSNLWGDLYTFVCNLKQENLNMELHTLRQLFLKHATDKTVTIINLIIDKKIHASVLKKNINTYISDLDLVISAETVFESPDHPFSEQQLREENFTGIVDKFNSDYGGINGLFVGIEIISNDDLISTRYINIGGVIHEITPTKSIIRKDGIYVNTLNSLTNVLQLSSYQLDNNDFVLYKTIEEAETHNHSDIKDKLKLESLRLENTKLKLQAENTKQESLFDQVLQDSLERNYNKKKLEYEEQLLRLKEEQERMKFHRENEKARTEDTREEKSYRRKENIEILKLIPAAIAVIMSVLYILEKNTKK